MQGLETVYHEHHKSRGDGFAILIKERGAFLRKHIGTGKKVLDLGCRDGTLTAEFVTGNTVTGVDVDTDALARAQKRLNIQTLHVDLNDTWNIPLNTYDVVVASELIEHVYFPSVVFTKVHEVLREGGIFVGTVPHAYSMQSRIKFLFGIKRGTPLEDPTHINQFSYVEFRALLRDQFDIQEIVGLVPSRYRFLAHVFPFAFAHDLLFCVQKKRS
jgi:2-polyprenyl-3-methyl-5-hydroxy-6-metoxy-1,4-benzoquinol methylase